MTLFFDGLLAGLIIASIILFTIRTIKGINIYFNKKNEYKNFAYEV